MIPSRISSHFRWGQDKGSFGAKNRRCWRSTCSRAFRGRLKQKIRKLQGNPALPRQKRHWVLVQIIGKWLAGGSVSNCCAFSTVLSIIPQLGQGFDLWRGASRTWQKVTMASIMQNADAAVKADFLCEAGGFITQHLNDVSLFPSVMLHPLWSPPVLVRPDQVMKDQAVH